MPALPEFGTHEREFLIDLVLALAAGVIIGAERELKGKPISCIPRVRKDDEAPRVEE